MMWDTAPGDWRQQEHRKGQGLLDRTSSTLVRWTFALVAACACTTHTWAAGPKVVFQIPAGQAQETLRQFYMQSQVRVLYLADSLKGVETHAVNGELEASEALAQLLQGTGLTYEFDGDDSAVIKVAPAGGTGSKKSAPGEGPQVPPPPDAFKETKLQEFLVTGSLIHGVLAIAAPLISIDKSEVKRSTYATVQDVVRSLPVAASITRGEVLAGTGNFGRGSSINLRGLGDGATLVLVNGRRQPVSGQQGDFVDVSNIPWSMVDHVEVLPDGGSALYGSDAIAGVVNIILRQHMEGAETQVHYGTAHDGAAELMLAQLVGHDWASGHWFAGYQYSNRTPLAAEDRGYTADADKRPLGGSNFRRTSSNPGNILDPQTLQPVFAIPRGQDGRSLTSSDLLPGVVNYQNQFADVELLPDVQTHNVYFTASQDLSEHLELFGEGRFGQRDFHQRPWIPDLGPIVVPATNPFFVDPFGGMPFVIMGYDFSKDLGAYTNTGRTRNYSGTLGLKTEFSHSWQASLAASYGRETLDVRDHGQADSYALNAALADPNPATAFNPFGDGSHTNPATLAAIQLPLQYTATSEIPSMQLLTDGPLLHLQSGILKAAIGAEYRRENWDYSIQSNNSQYTRGARLGRTITAAFTELSVPLIGDAVDSHAVPKLELSLAGRYEHYSDFGRTFNPKIGLRWTPLTAVKLRTSWGTSFKAPNLIDLYSANTGSFVLPLRDPLSPTGRSNVLGIAGGNSQLKEERATTWTAGLDLAPTPLPGFQLSLTAYWIDYKDQVIQPGPASNPADVLLQEDQWASLVIRNPSQSQIDAVCDSTKFLPDPAQCRTSSPAAIFDGRKHNLAITKVTGVDFSLSQTFDTDIGHFNIGVNGSYVFHFDRAFTNTAPTEDILNTVNNPLKLRLRGTLDWHQYGEQQPGFGATLTVNYTGDYKDAASTEKNSVDGRTTFDLGLKYRTGNRRDWLDDTELAFNVINVLNKNPPFVDREWGYDIVNARPEGRVISASLSKRW